MARILVEPWEEGCPFFLPTTPSPPPPGLAGSAWWTKTRGTSAVIAGSRSASGAGMKKEGEPRPPPAASCPTHAHKLLTATAKLWPQLYDSVTGPRVTANG